MDVSVDRLQRAVEGQHGGRAVPFGAEPVKETFDGKAAWEGTVHVFDLEGHPKTARAHARSSPIEGSSKRGFMPSCTRAASARRSMRCARLSLQGGGSE